MSEWKSRALGDVFSIEHGYAFPGEGFSDEVNYPTLVTPRNFKVGGGFQAAKPKTFQGDYPPKFRLAPGDVIVTMTDLSKNTDTLGYSAVVPDDNTYLHNQRIGKVVITAPHLAHSSFITYLLRQRDYRSFVVGSASGSTVKHTSPSRIESYVAKFPPLDEQRRIASVLGGLDDLIETNRQTISNLRSLASSAYAQATVGGEWVPFEEVASLVRDGVRPEELDPDTPYIGLEHFGTDGAGLVDVGDTAEVDSNKSRFVAGDVLYGKLRPYFRKYDRPGFDGVCSTEIWVLRPHDGWGAATVNASVARPEFTNFAMAGSGGTRMPRANWKHVTTMPAPVPPADKCAEVDQQLDELWRAMVDLQEEIAELTRTRDELLPLLMSGRVRVDDVDVPYGAA